MTEYLRLADESAEFTYDRAKVEALGLQDLVIDKDPLGPDGLPAPTKPRLPMGEPLPGSSSDRRRQTAKESVAAKKKTTEADSPGEDAGQTSAAPETEN